MTSEPTAITDEANTAQPAAVAPAAPPQTRRRKNRASGLSVSLAGDLREWVEAQAARLGCDASTLVAMTLAAAKEGQITPRFTLAPALPVPAARANRQFAPAAQSAADPDAWRGPVEDEPGESTDIDAVVDDVITRMPDRPSLPPQEMFAHRPEASQGATVRPLHVPPSKIEMKKAGSQ